jgi:hypothetical protein
MIRDGYAVRYFHGTVGAGKSHLLAALACLLMRQGKIVVFIPDCNELLADPAGYFAAALEFAYVNKNLQPHLQALLLPTPDESTTLERLTQFSSHVAENADRPLFIVDQANALEDAEDNDDPLEEDESETEVSDDDSPLEDAESETQGSDNDNPLEEAESETPRFDNAKKQVVRSFLGACTAPHTMLAGCTPNCQHPQPDRYPETSEKPINLYGGLNDVISCLPV